MDKFYVWLIVTIILFSTCSVYAENKQKLSNPGSSISETKTKFSGEPTSPIKDQDFYKATVQAYKDFNEQVVHDIGSILKIVSAIVAGLIILFVFLFRRSLSEIRKDIKDDTERINDVYAKTFELLNKQADTNLRIFESRETELKEKIKEAKEITEKIKDIFIKISDKESIREPVAEALINKEFEGVQKESTEIKKEIDSIKEDLENIHGEE